MKLTDEILHPNMQNRFARAKFALCGVTGVTRRDGLSSWRVILYGPVGMSIGLLNKHKASKYTWEVWLLNKQEKAS